MARNTPAIPEPRERGTSNGGAGFNRRKQRQQRMNGLQIRSVLLLCLLCLLLFKIEFGGVEGTGGKDAAIIPHCGTRDDCRHGWRHASQRASQGGIPAA